MAKYMRLIVVLVVISIFSGAVLAQTYKITYPNIKQNALKKQEEAIMKVIPGAAKYKDISKDNLKVFKGLDENGNFKGIAFIAEGGGFGGSIKLMVGLNPEEEVLTGMTVLSHLETPGLGARIEEDWFKEQFKGKSIHDKFVAKQDIDAITGATISSNAVGSIIKNTIEKVYQVYGGEF